VNDSDWRLMAILRIAHSVSAAGGATSLHEALARTRYDIHRPSFGPEEIRSMLIKHPSLVEQWLSYSEDKRTDAGWYVLRDGEIGQVLQPRSQRSYATIQEAVAHFIIRELDSHAGLSA
jgi:hypothetical protein